MIIVANVTPTGSPAGADGSDVALRQRLQAALERQPWYADATAQLFVEDGVVTVDGLATDEALAQALCSVARGVAGADKVRDALIRVDAVSGSALALG